MLRFAQYLSQLSILACAALLIPASVLSQQERQVQVTVNEGTNMAVALSPDGRTLAIDLQGRIWTMPVDGGEAVPITDEFGDTRQPAWSPDGSRIVFQSFRDANWHIWSISADGSDLKQHTFGPYDDREPHWSSDGNSIVFASDRAENYDIWLLDVTSGELQQLTTHEDNDYGPAFSPDGSSIAFVSVRDTLPGIWIRDATGALRPVARAPASLSGPSWSPDGRSISFNATSRREAQLLVFDIGDSIAETRLVSAEREDVFPFRAAWLSGNEFLYTADGRIKRNNAGGNVPGEVPFTAVFELTRHDYARKVRDYDSTDPEPVMGIISPAVSPDGNHVAFMALGDLWVLPVGGEPQRITDDRYIDLYPIWSPDGSRLAFASDRGGNVDLWIRNMDTGEETQLTHTGGTVLPAWSPDGSRIVFNGQLGLSSVLNMVDVATGEVTQLRDDLFGPGRASFSPDGSTIAFSALNQYSSRFREGRNEILLMSLNGEPDRRVSPLPHTSIGMRGLDGPVWSPDGNMMAFVSGGFLQVVPVNHEGDLLGPPRVLSNELADAISWTGDSKSIVYQTTDGLRRVSLDDGAVAKIPVDLTWAPSHPSGRVVVHAGRLFDGNSETMLTNVDIVIEGQRIVEVVPHSDDLHGDSVVDASNMTVMPGLIEAHSHLGYDLGESIGRIWLSYGITLVRDPGSDTYAIRERREAVRSGRRVGPREIASGNLLDGSRIYYGGLSVPLEAGPQLGLMLERAEALDVDFLKTYVRLPDLMQKRIVEFGHVHGVPTTSHEIYPAVAYGTDHVEHIGGTSRRGYQPKVTRLNRTYQDVIALLGESGMTITPTVGISGGFWLAAARDATVLDDPRMHTFYGTDYLQYATGRVASMARNLAGLEASMEPLGSTVRRVVDAGGLVLAGTDSPIVPYGVSLHTELENYVDGGLSPYEALQTATVVPARALGLGDELGSVAPGMLADLVMVAGNPLEDIRDARRVLVVVKNGQVFTIEELLEPPVT